MIGVVWRDHDKHGQVFFHHCSNGFWEEQVVGGTILACINSFLLLRSGRIYIISGMPECLAFFFYPLYHLGLPRPMKTK